MPNNSSTGGFLTPAALPVQGQALNRFLQPWLVGVTGLPANMVRPSFQPEPPDIPDAGTVWMAFRYTTRLADTFPYIEHISNFGDTMQRHEQLDMLCTFYDLGTNGLADQYAQILREGSALPQNNEYLMQQKFLWAYTGELTAVPVLVKQRWQYRVDLPITLRRQIDMTYPILDVASAQGILYTDTGLPPRNVGVTQ